MSLILFSAECIFAHLLWGKCISLHGLVYILLRFKILRFLINSFILSFFVVSSLKAKELGEKVALKAQMEAPRPTQQPTALFAR